MAQALRVLKENSSNNKVVYFNSKDEILAQIEYHRSELKKLEKMLNDIELSEKSPKLRKDGEVKQTPNNQKSDRWVQGIKDINDVKRIIQYFEQKVEMAATPKKRRSAHKELLIFVIGINTGYRVSDLLELKWEDLYTDISLTKLRQYRTITEKKTGKKRKFYTNEAIEKFCGEYIEKYKTDLEYGDYIFSKDGKKPYSKQTVQNMIKECTRCLGIEGDYNTHSLRKTYALHMEKYYDEVDGKGQQHVQALFGHSNDLVTLTYLGVTQAETAKATQKLNLGL